MLSSLCISVYLMQMLKKVHCFNNTNEVTTQQTENLENY